MIQPVVTRFAPSPTGRLHLGHAASVLAAYDFAQAHGGRFLLRLEDIDQGRCRASFVDGIVEDLAWLGLRWEEPVRVQSQHLDSYATAIEQLRARKLIYPCFCTRADIAAAATAPHGPEGLIYPGTCKHSLDAERRMAQGESHAWRLHADRALALTGPLTWQDIRAGTIAADAASLGDVVLARKDMPTSYHLAVTLDDALQGVTHVIRGEDLFHVTHVHRLLQALLDLPSPVYAHHPLLCGPDGKRLAKRDASASLQALRGQGATPADIRAQVRGVMSLVLGTEKV